ncbi:hypothetical protein HMPREF9420_0859 [Segatella salivae DSM 15606]|uniref:Uncharacterized protein n=1 Tax=Segatella salivae DSM 15606 TaxID=888832 RepID=E6MMZ1_9BACT|nr:hypothetical protein HMPREF9420_0859 [Segatella salivae DSM 15606]
MLIINTWLYALLPLILMYKMMVIVVQYDWFLACECRLFVNLSD